MAHILGPGRRKALETRRSPLDVGRMFCTACSTPPQFVYVRTCRVVEDGLMRPGVRCPQCRTAWIEQDDQPEATR